MRQFWSGTDLYLINPTPLELGAVAPKGHVTVVFDCEHKLGPNIYANSFAGLEPNVESALQMLRRAVRAQPSAIAYVTAHVRLIAAEVESDAYRAAVAAQVSASAFFGAGPDRVQGK